MAGDAIVTFKCLWRIYSDVVVWCYNTRKFLVFSHAKLPKNWVQKSCLLEQGRPWADATHAAALGPAPWCL